MLTATNIEDSTSVRRLPNSAIFCFVRIKKHLPEEQKNPVYYPDGASMAQRDAEYAPQGSACGGIPFVRAATPRPRDT
jgi:hypothetical protein